MQKFFNAIVLLGLVAVSFQGTQHAINDLNKLRQSNSKDMFMSEIVSLSQLHLQSSSQGQYEKIVQLIKNLADDIQNKQIEASQYYEHWTAVWDKEVAELKAAITLYKKNIEQTESAISKMEAHIVKDKKLIRKLTLQIDVDAGKQRLLKEAHQQDVANTKTRVERQGEMLKAINYIVGQLNNFLKTGKVFNHMAFAEIQNTLARLAKENPAEALVQLTMTFSNKDVEFAISKLESIKVALEASLKNEAAEAAKHQRQYANMMATLVSLHEEWVKEKTETQADLAKSQSTLAHLKETLAKYQQNLATAQQNLATTLKDLADLKANYIASTKERSHENEVLGKVVDVLNAHQSAMKAAEANSFTPKF